MNRRWMAVLVLALAACESDTGSGVSDAQYKQWRSECEAVATADLDTRVHQVGGNHWVDEVNRCLLEKAKD